ncbi:ESCRT-II complex, vps25 subunit [Neoconidiobolus thromboides FSU 785]|nr:ESCRT-II complex, vps25 subunit [Neoconidiobolus thromboides FSU 785]
MSFQYPKIFDFPPLFSKQIVPKIQEEQIEHWKQIILNYYYYHRLFLLDINLFNKQDISMECFENKKIGRKLNLDFLKEIVTEMYKCKLVLFEDEKFIILWRKPNEWADIIYQWVKDNGQNNKTFLLMDLIDDEDHKNEEFFNIPLLLLKESIKVLEKENKAKLFLQNNLDCVKFS